MGGGAAGAETAMLVLFPMLVGMLMLGPRPRSMGVLLAGLMGGGGPPPMGMLGVRLRAASGWDWGGSCERAPYSTYCAGHRGYD